MSVTFSFGDIRIGCALRGIPIWMDGAAADFRVFPEEAPNHSYISKELPPELLRDYERIQYTSGYELLQGRSDVFHLNHWASLRTAFGFFLKDLSGLTTVYYHPKLQGLQPMSASYFLSTVGLHRKLLEKDALILHASYIEVQGGGILFLGPSGIGKSTQARLWEAQGMGRILNGDRALLRKKGGRWFVHGYPCCGSSQICINRSLPLKAIVLLKQDRGNFVQDLSACKKILAITGGSQLYPWVPEESQKVISLAESLIKEAPMVELSCTPEEEAVHCLQRYLSAL